MTTSPHSSANNVPKHNGNEKSSPLVLFAKSILPISPGAEEYVNRQIKQVHVHKGGLLVRSGEHCDHLYFVQRGILRGFTRQGTKDITTWITAENELVTSISGYYKQIPSIENIEAIEDSVLWSLHRDDMHYLYAHFPEINILVRIILEKYYQDAEERAYICRLTEATAKYQRFINTKSHFINRIPLKYIASYLGMTLETLSRIRSRMSLRK